MINPKTVLIIIMAAGLALTGWWVRGILSARDAAQAAARAARQGEAAYAEEAKGQKEGLKNRTATVEQITEAAHNLEGQIDALPDDDDTNWGDCRLPGDLACLLR
jgi:DNA-binding PucR family transcriptional regulator